MKKIIFTLLVFVPLLVFGQNTYYVAPTNGWHEGIGYNEPKDTNIGSKDNPWATWQRAFNTAKAGDLVYFREGVWYPNNNETFVAIFNPHDGHGNDGTVDNPIVFSNYPGEQPILDCSKNFVQSAIQVGLYIANAEYTTFRGLDVRNVYTWARPGGYEVDCHGVFIQDCGTVNFEDMAVYNISGKVWWITHNKHLSLINCDAYNACDSLDYSAPGGDADGFNIGSGVASGVENDMTLTIRGCRAWNCSDDGFDMSWSKTVHIDSCWSFFNGALYDTGYRGDGTGIKFGTTDVTINGGDPINARIVERCVVAFNKGWHVYGDVEVGAGFDMNNLQGGENRALYQTYRNNTVYKNFYNVVISAGGSGGWDYLADGGSVVMQNNLIYDWLAPDISYSAHLTRFIAQMDYATQYVHPTTESWDWINNDPSNLWFNRYNPAFNITDDDFTSVDSVQIFNQLSAPRKTDGSLPDITVLQLAEGSDLIDGGTNVGLPFAGSAPDLGAFEYGTVVIDNPPSASFSATPTIITLGESVSFDASNSSDDNGIAAYNWDFDGGATNTSGVTANVTFNTAGTYNVVLTVIDTNGAMDTESKTIAVNSVPTITTKKIEVTRYFPNPTAAKVMFMVKTELEEDINIEVYASDDINKANPIITGTINISTLVPNNNDEYKYELNIGSNSIPDGVYTVFIKSTTYEVPPIDITKLTTF